jgi:hypothetical protein
MPPPTLEIEGMPGGVRLDWPASATGWKPEYSSTLDENDWHPLPEDAATFDDGRTVMEPTGDGPAMFYRLRREAED